MGKDGKTSKYMGVWWLSREKIFMAAIKIKGRRKVCGYYANPVNAAHARDLVAREAGMDESQMNFPKKETDE